MKEASNFVFDNFINYEQRGHTFCICYVEIKRIYVDMKEKDRLCIEYIETDKPSKKNKKGFFTNEKFTLLPRSIIMRTIRNKVFETNSSSCHSITINNQAKPRYDHLTPTLYLHFGKFGWEKKTYSDPQNKLVYMATAAAYIYTAKEIKEMAQNIAKYFNEKEFIDVHLLLKAYNIKDGYFEFADKNYYIDIDHQSCPAKNKECRKLAKMFANPKAVYKFVMNRNNKIITDNDN